MSHYETFVIRLWIEDGGDMGHGEVRHLTSGTGFRFRRVQQAMNFIEEIAGRPEGQTPQTRQMGAVGGSPPADDVFIDFEHSSREG